MENKSRPGHKKTTTKQKKRPKPDTLDIHGTENSGTMRWQRLTYYTRVQKKWEKTEEKKIKIFPKCTIGISGIIIIVRQ